MKVETGTGGMNGVDISWIPQETLNIMSKLSFVMSFNTLVIAFLPERRKTNSNSAYNNHFFGSVLEKASSVFILSVQR